MRSRIGDSSSDGPTVIARGRESAGSLIVTAFTSRQLGVDQEGRAGWTSDGCHETLRDPETLFSRAIECVVKDQE
jgi:hypothetical protein